MRISHIDIIEHPDVPSNEARIICDINAPQLPQELRNKVSVPCILTGDLALNRNMLTLMIAQTLSDHLVSRDGGRPVITI